MALLMHIVFNGMEEPALNVLKELTLGQLVCVFQSTITVELGISLMDFAFLVTSDTHFKKELVFLPKIVPLVSLILDAINGIGILTNVFNALRGGF